jgi:V8-like Glu-specific endopeptidase
MPLYVSRSEISKFKESICEGKNNSQDVEAYEQLMDVTKEFVMACQKPVGLIEWNEGLVSKYKRPGNVSGKPFGTGCLISDNLFLSAGHNFDSEGNIPRINDTDVLIPPQEIAKNMHIAFNHQLDPDGQNRETQNYQVVELVEHRLGGIDYAIVRLADNPSKNFGFLNVLPIVPELNQTICIIGHPNGWPKMIDVGSVTHVHEVSDPLFGYGNIDTLGGDSGAPVIAFPSGKIIGVHTNGGCEDTSIGHNHGQKIASIAEASQII